MKKILFKGLMILAAGVLAVACSKEYLDTAPQDDQSPLVLFSNTDYARLAINGIAKSMTKQYLGTQGLNGEGVIKTWYGNFGNDLQRCNHTSWAALWNHTYNERTNSIYLYYPWFYYYKIIGNANQVIVNIDEAEGPEAERQYIKAQALVYRAYSYTMLTQLYCYRWCDGKGSQPGLVLRLDTSVDSLPLSTLAETFAQIYKDLDEAIDLFTKSGLDREEDEFYLPALDVAQAVYARAALIREDWATAAKYAALAKAGHPLMSKSDYMNSGFHTPNDEWIWGVYEAEDQTLYYYSYFAYQGSDASSGMQRNYPLAISKELYDQIPASDARRKMWLEPTDAEAAELNAAGRSTKALYKRAFAEYGSKLYSTSLVYQYMQFKFQVEFYPGGGSFNIIRSAEMYLTEAEALANLNQYAEVRTLLNQLNANLDPDFDASAIADADLLDAVRLYRRIDLWGEGFDYFDYKRWKLPIVRKSAKQGGSFHTTFAITINPEDGNNLTWKIPERETDYNDLVN